MQKYQPKAVFCRKLAKMACLQLWFVFPATFLPLVWLHRPGQRRTAQHGAPLSGRHSQKIFLLSKQVILGPNHKYCIAANFKRFPPCTPRWNCGNVGCLSVWCGGDLVLVLQLLAIYIIVPLLLLLPGVMEPRKNRDWAQLKQRTRSSRGGEEMGSYHRAKLAENFNE